MSADELAFAGTLCFLFAFVLCLRLLYREVTSPPLIGDDFWSDEDGAA